MAQVNNFMKPPKPVASSAMGKHMVLKPHLRSLQANSLRKGASVTSLGNKPQPVIQGAQGYYVVNPKNQEMWPLGFS